MVGVDVLVHRNDEDVLARGFVVHFEVVGIAVFERIAGCLQLFAIADGGLPGVKLLVIDGEKDVLAWLAVVAHGVVAGVDLGV